MSRLRIYVAGPLSSDPMGCTTAALKAGSDLMDLGFAPFIPHLSVFWHIASPRPYEDWMELDLAWVEVADALLRLPGASSGADREVALARSLGMPVFDSIADLDAWKCDLEGAIARTGDNQSAWELPAPTGPSTSFAECRSGHRCWIRAWYFRGPKLDVQTGGEMFGLAPLSQYFRVREVGE